MNPTQVIVRFETVAEQAANAVSRIIGFVRARELLPLFDAADLDANPRSAKSGAVTNEILESIADTPDLFVFKTKGILVGAASCERLQRMRYRLSFENTNIEGILDGGHNALAIGTHILIAAVGEGIKRKVRTWQEFKDQWEANRDEIERLRKLKATDDVYNADDLDFLVPLEILVPAQDDEEIIEEFNNSLLSICSARNNNVQLTTETRANKKGFYEILRAELPEEISQRVEWKTNDGGDVRVRDLIALSWIPLSALDLEFLPKIPPQNTYRNKGECVKLFDEFMADERVSSPAEGDYTREIDHKAVRSALKLAADLPELYDYIYRKFPEAYNATGGKFGGISIVRLASNMKTVPVAHFTDEAVDYSYPDGLIMPLVYGLQKLMRASQTKIEWTQDPYEFLDANLVAIVKKYRVILDALKFDPQKVGKNEGSYNLVLDAYETQLMLQDKAA